MTSHRDNTIDRTIRGWWHDPFEDMGYSAVVRQWGTYWSNGQVYVSGLAVTQVDPFLDDLRAYFSGRTQSTLVHLDTEEDKARIGPALIDAGCNGPARESFLFHTLEGHTLPPTIDAIHLAPVSNDNLAVFSDTKLRAWSSSEEKPSGQELQAEIARRNRELRGSGRGMLAMIGDTPAGFIWWHDETSRVRWIRQVATRTPYRRRGVATRLILSCVETAYQQGMTAVVISVDPDNQKALRLYSGMGFSHSGYDLHIYTYASLAQERSV